MKLKVLPVLLFAFSTSSCMRGTHSKKQPPIAKDTLNYTYKVIKERASDCGNKADSNCTVAKIKYPVFTGQKNINDSIQHKLLKIFLLNDQKDTTLKQIVANFIKEYDRNKKSDERKLFYTLDLSATVIQQDSSLAVIELGGYAFEGGAHGGYQSIFVNWDTKANKKINLNDILTNGFQEKLNKIAEHIFRRQEKLSDTASLADAYFFDNDRFTLNDNYAITSSGIRFLYNEYEIKSYSEGITELFIPYSQIKSLLRPNTVVAQYIK
jgi:hypothetical protein